MKIRNGFVSNSSSCSFYVSINTDRRKLSEISNLIYRVNEFEFDMRLMRLEFDRDYSEFCIEVEASYDNAEEISDYFNDNGIKYKYEGEIYNEDTE